VIAELAKHSLREVEAEIFEEHFGGKRTVTELARLIYGVDPPLPGLGSVRLDEGVEIHQEDRACGALGGLSLDPSSLLEAAEREKEPG